MTIIRIKFLINRYEEYLSKLNENDSSDMQLKSLYKDIIKDLETLLAKEIIQANGDIFSEVK